MNDAVCRTCIGVQLASSHWLTCCELNNLIRPRISLQSLQSSERFVVLMYGDLHRASDSRTCRGRN